MIEKNKDTLTLGEVSNRFQCFSSCRWCKLYLLILNLLYLVLYPSHWHFWGICFRPIFFNCIFLCICHPLACTSIKIQPLGFITVENNHFFTEQCICNAFKDSRTVPSNNIFNWKKLVVYFFSFSMHWTNNMGSINW